MSGPRPALGAFRSDEEREEARRRLAQWSQELREEESELRSIYGPALEAPENGTAGEEELTDSQGRRVSPEALALVEAELGLEGFEALEAGADLGYRVRSERVTVLARRVVREERLAREADLDGIDVVTAAELLRRERPPRVRVLGDVLLEGHNATVVARWKVGKSTLVDNVAAAVVAGDNWLGRFPVPRPMRVALLNYELVEEDMDARLRALGLDAEATERLLVLNLRGKRLPLTVALGRRWLASRLADHGAELVVLDPFGAAYRSAGGESENDNAEVRGFLLALDEIKAEAGCKTLVMPVHTGRAEAVEGDEQGRGATVLEDWPDVRMILTKDREEIRYLRTEGRAPWQLHESRLSFDLGSRRLTLDAGDVGVSRREARKGEQARLVTDLVLKQPGMNTTELYGALTAAGVTNNEEKAAARAAAVSGRVVHTHKGYRGAVLHFAGDEHLNGEVCPGGFVG